MDIIQKAKELQQYYFDMESDAKLEGSDYTYGEAFDLISRLVDRLEWKPINNCPVDEIVLFNVNDYLNSYDTTVSLGLMSDEMEYISVSNGKKLMDKPTHWLPLPPVGDK